MTEQITKATTTDPQEPPQEPQDVPEATDEPSEPQEGTEEPDTFPRDYVERLRDESAKYRQRAQRADDLAHRLHTAMVAATGRLADPSDLDFAAEHLDDADALNVAVDDLLTRKPHLASRRPRGDVGQGVSATADTVDLAGILRSRA